MNDHKLPPDDPRLTAYALGELEVDERAAVEAALHRDPRLRATVDEIRATATQIEDALAAEPEPSIFSTPPMELKAGTHPPAAAAAAVRPNGDPRRQPQLNGGSWFGGHLIHFPRVCFMITGLAAACLALFFSSGTNRPLRIARWR
jgi:anti-sigma factor RsiW